MKFSKDGYKRNSKDRNNPYNVIPSGNITMRGVDFPVFGMDNLGNSRVMMPGSNYTFPGSSVFEVPLAQGGIEIPKRKGVRLNYDKEGNVIGESTHLMKAEQLEDGTWVSFPSLFQNEDEEWIDMSEETNWMKIYEEAKRRGEVINFGDDKEAALEFGKGSWKPDLPQLVVDNSIERAYYDPHPLVNTIYMNQKELDAGNILPHEMYHWKQRNSGELFENPLLQSHPVGPVTAQSLLRDHYNRRAHDHMREAQMMANAFGSDSQFIPNFIFDHSKQFMYVNPNTAEGEAVMFENLYKDNKKYLRDQKEVLKNAIYKQNGGSLFKAQGGGGFMDQVKSMYDDAMVKYKQYEKEGYKLPSHDNPFLNNLMEGYVVKGGFNGKDFEVYDANGKLDPMRTNFANLYNDVTPYIDKIKRTTKKVRNLLPFQGGGAPKKYIGQYTTMGDDGVYNPYTLTDEEMAIANKYQPVVDFYESYLKGNTFNYLYNKILDNTSDPWVPHFMETGLEFSKQYVEDYPYIKQHSDAYGWNPLVNKVNVAPSIIEKRTNTGGLHTSNAGNQITTKSRISIDPQNEIIGPFSTEQQEGIMAHELGHTEGRFFTGSPELAAEINKRNKAYQRVWNNLSEEDKKRMTENPVEIDYWLKDNYNSSSDFHDAATHEVRSDLIRFRYLADKAGIYDSSGDYKKFNESDLKKMKEQFGNNRLFRHFEDEDIIWLMDNVAQQTPDGTGNPYEIVDDFGQSSFLSKHGGQLPKAQDGIFDILQRQQDLRNVNSSPYIFQRPGSGVFPTPNISAIARPTFFLGKDATVEEFNQYDLDSAVNFAAKWMSSPRYKSMLRNSGGTDWWTNSSDIAEARIENLENIQKNPLYFEDDPNPSYTEEQLKGIAGYSENESGNIYVKNKRQYDSTLYDHEVSHSIDRPILNDPVTDFFKFYGRGIGSEPRLIPNKDIDLIGSLIDESIPINKPVTFWKKYGDTPEEGTRNYFAEPTEVRARLNEMRKTLYNSGFDIFNKKVTLEDLENIPTNGLEKIYGKEAILELMNSISENQPTGDDVVSFDQLARYGKQLSQAQDGNEVKFEDLEKGIRYAESLNGELMLNPESTATGLYGQLWSEVENMYDGTREEFSEDLDYQKKLFKDRANGLIEGIPGLIKNGTDIYNEYSDVEHGMSMLEIAALSNMLGRQGTRKYIGNHIRDGKSLSNVFPHLYGDDANQTNKTPIEYIEKFNKGLLGLKLGGEIGKKLRRLKQQLKLYNEGKEISGIVRKELMDRGLIQPLVMQTGGSVEPYTIKQGDYLGKIARDRGLSVDEVIAFNPKFKDRRSTIYPGEVVYFDEQSKNIAESNEPVLTYTIQKGDTLGEIATTHKVSLAEVAELNNLTGDQINRIYPGNQLIMPKHAQYIKNESTERQEKIAKSPVTTEDTIVINEFNPINEVWVTRERNEDGTYSTVGGKKQRVDEINLYDNYETIINAKNDGDTSSSTETYTVKQGDTLGAIAANRDGVTVNSIAYNNNIDDPNNIMVGQKLKITKTASKPYLIVDKQKGKMHLLYPGEDTPRDSYDILLGTMIGDQATKTVTTYSYNGKELSQEELNDHMKDNGVKTIPELLKLPGYRQASFDQYGGNRQTGAGKYTISAANPDGGRTYRGDSGGALVPSFNLVSDAGVEQALAIHGVTRGRVSNLYDGIGTNNRLTTGCINGKCVDLQSLYDNPDIGVDTELYILPEEEGSSFVYENGKLNFYTSKENQERAEEGYYKTEKNQKRFEGKGGDEGEFVKGGPGINVTTNFGNYRPIQFEFDIDSYKNSSIPDGNENNLNDEYQQNTKPFLDALAKNKKPLMDLLNIDGDLYNNIALTAFGIYGNESGMGDINDPVEDFFQAGRKGLMSQISDTSYGSGSVQGKYRYAYDPSQSVGWTQLRVGYGFTDPRERELLAEADEKFGTNFATPLNGSNGGYDDVRNHPDYNTLSKEDKEKAENNGYKGGIFLPKDKNGDPIKGMSTQYHMYKIDNSELMDQEKSALATMIILTNRYQTQIPVEEKNAPGFDIFNRLPLTWRPTGDEEVRQNYVNLVNKNMQFVKLIESDIEDFDENVITKGSFGAYDVPYGFFPIGRKFKRGGEFGLDKQVQFYEDYVNDLYKNTNQEKSANKLYDKLNRMYYNDSRGTGGNTLDTMRAMNEQSNN
tara:strand:- start:2662 stop:9156 length:6495 start_codon:yes stop_codon:yes gene_type:complete